MTRLWCMVRERGVNGLPPVHRDELDARRGAQRGEEEIPVGFGTARAADPDWSPAVEVADDDAVVVPLPGGDLVHTNRLRRGQASAGTCCCMEILSRSLTMLSWRRSA
jgi:hypothetical protein